MDVLDKTLKKRSNASQRTTFLAKKKNINKKN